MLTKQAANYCLKQGFVDACVKHGITKEQAIDRMMKYASVIILNENKQKPKLKLAMKKRALSDMEIQNILQSLGIQATPQDVKDALSQQNIDLNTLSASDLQGMLA